MSRLCLVVNNPLHGMFEKIKACPLFNSINWTHFWIFFNAIDVIIIPNSTPCNKVTKFNIIMQLISGAITKPTEPSYCAKITLKYLCLSIKIISNNHLNSPQKCIFLTTQFYSSAPLMSLCHLILVVKFPYSHIFVLKLQETITTNVYRLNVTYILLEHFPGALYFHKFYEFY